MPVNGRLKGAAAEREVAALLAPWWDKVDPGAKFVRTPLSGGWGNAQLRGEFKAAGDIATSSKLWPFTVEVKRRENWTLNRLVAGGRSPVWAWWQQNIREGKEERRIPILWLRRSRSPWLVMMPATFAFQAFGTAGCDILWPESLSTRFTGGVLPSAVLGETFLNANPATLLALARDFGVTPDESPAARP